MCRTIILPVVLYICKTCSLILKEELRLWVCKYRVLRKISGSRKDEVTGDRRRLHIEELLDLYSPNINQVIISTRTRCIGMGRGNLRERVTCKI
jgi:hypothetical protein